jgi:hypothetical protein
MAWVTQPDDPVDLCPESEYLAYAPGLTKREHFAGLAMQGLMQTPLETPEDIAQLAVEHADALILELNKGVTA